MSSRNYLTAVLLASALLSGCKNAEETVIARIDSAEETMPYESELLCFDPEDLDETVNMNEATVITLNGMRAECYGEGVSVSGNEVTLSRSGTYVIAGELNDGSIIVDTKDTDPIRLIFNQAGVISSSGPAVDVRNASKVILGAVTGTDNTLQSVSAEGIKAEGDLVINGGGSLSISAEAGDGIYGMGMVKIINTMLEIKSADDGIEAGKLAAVHDCILTIKSNGTGIKTGIRQDEEDENGQILIEGGVITIDAENDCLVCSGDIITEHVELNLTDGRRIGNETISLPE